MLHTSSMTHVDAVIGALLRSSPHRANCHMCAVGLQARSLPTASLRPLFLVFNAVVYAVQVALWVLTGLASSSSTHNLLRVASCAFLALVSVCAAIGFLVYGGRLYLMLQRCEHCCACMSALHMPLSPLWPTAPLIVSLHSCHKY